MMGRFSDNNEMWVHKVRVSPVYRGQGIATKIMELIMQHADESGITLLLEPLPADDMYMTEAVLKKWYERLGFEDVTQDYPELNMTILRREPT